MRPEAIVLHHSLTADGKTVSWDNIREYHVGELGWRDIGYHYGIEIVDDSVEILVGRLMNENGAHCKQGGLNRKSLGVCFVGNFDQEPPPAEVWKVGVRLIASLCEVFHIASGAIYGHREWASYKSCPGNEFNLEQFRAEVRRTIGIA